MSVRFLLPILLLWLTGCGDTRWEVVSRARFTSPVILEQDRLYATSSSFGVTRHLRAFDARTGQEHWQVEIGGWEDCPQIAVRDGQVLVGCGSTASGFDAITGQRLWRAALSGPLESNVALQEQAAVLVARLPTGELELTLLQAASGQEVLRKSLPAGSRVFSLQGGVLLLSGATLTALEPATGAQRWTLPLKSEPRGLTGSAAGLFATTEDSILGIDPETGTQKWTRPTEGQVAPTSLDSLLCFAQSGALFGIDAETGQEKWQSRIAGVVSAPSLTHDVVYVHTAGGLLHALSSVDGEPLWKLQAGPPGVQSTLNDELYVWAVGRELRAVDLIHRQLLPSIPLPGAPSASPLTQEQAIQTPLRLSGPQVYGIDSGHRLFMYLLEP